MQTFVFPNEFKRLLVRNELISGSQILTTEYNALLKSTSLVGSVLFLKGQQHDDSPPVGVRSRNDYLGIMCASMQLRFGGSHQEWHVMLRPCSLGARLRWRTNFGLKISTVKSNHWKERNEMPVSGLPMGITALRLSQGSTPTRQSGVLHSGLKKKTLFEQTLQIS